MDEKTKNNCKVVILTAGKGSRLGNRTTYFNKALLRVGDKAVISHTIDQFSTETEFVIALGYKGDIVKQYLQEYHSDRKFIFVDVDKYSEPGSGPAYAMLKCKDYLQCPFYFVSCDTLVEHIPSYEEKNLIGYKLIPKDKIKDYCTFDKTDDGERWGFWDKSTLEYASPQAFIGLALIYDYQKFWNHLDFRFKHENKDQTKEYQIAPAILTFDHCDNIHRVECNDWFDTGNEEGLAKARKHFGGVQNLDKVDEEIYINEKDNFVVKYFHNENMVKYRIERAKKLGDTIPKIISHSKNFYKYEYIKGQDLFKIDNQHEIMNSLLDYTQKNLWTDIKLKSYDELIFSDVCKNFYHDKTMSRLNKVHEQLGINDQQHTINDREIPSLKYMFERINWKDLCLGTPSNIHGDWNFSNIVLTDNKEFKFLDWRQDFGGIIDYGDRYYDFAKMYACLLWPHTSIKEGHYGINYDSFAEKKIIGAWIEIPSSLKECSNILTKWLFNSGYDVRKAKILTAIVWLNMSPLHENPLNKHLYFWGKYHLYEALVGHE